MINAQAKKGPLVGRPPISDPIEDIGGAHVNMLEWHMQSRQFGMTAVQLERLQQKSVVVFESFKSTFTDSCMQRKGVHMLYERAATQVPTLYVCPVENVLGRVPLIP